MVSGVKKAFMALAAVMLLAIPALVEARAVHNFSCTECHKSGVSYYDLGGNNICLTCHSASAPRAIQLGIGVTVAPQGRFEGGDASNAIGANPSPISEVSHMWAGASTTGKEAAGATEPTTYTTQFNGRYGVSRNRVTCSRCHDPHGVNDVDSKLLKVPVDNDEMCKACHSPWNVANADALLTHPVGPTTNYAAVAAANPTKFRASVTNTGSGDVRLLNGEVSCTSCHGVHYTDSDASTNDGMYQQTHFGPSGSNDPRYTTGLNTGDGKLLRSDGALKTVTPYNDANSSLQAQIRSNLCQACHTYKLHGNTTDGGPQIGCLDCHSGHAYNGGTPNVFVLRRTTSTYAPRYANAYTTGIDLMAGIGGKYDAPYSKTSNDVWSNRIVGVGGYCENCHGDVQSAPIAGKAIAHSAGNQESCTTCHHHDGSGWSHSWQPDVSAATCGDCHGFPPYLSQAGNRNTGGTDGGYAFAKDEIAPGNDWDYLNDSGAYKLEAQTAHNTHAGGSAANPDYYFVGSSGTENCNVCHGDNAGFDSRHRDTSRAASFRDVTFNAVASAGGALAPSYKTSNPNIWTCNNVYCHTNGGPKDNAGVKTYQVHVTPAWDQASGGGKDYIFLSATRCQFCHGNDSASMTTRANSAVHNKHLTKGYACNVCHVDTATSNTALKAGATRGNIGGKHVNGAADVGFDTAYNLGAATLTVGGTPYTSSNGTCQVYCHSDGKGNLYGGADWQVASTGACGTCHLTTTLASGSHSRHVSDANGPTLACSECHGANADAGTHAGHINGSVGVTTGVCNTCHGVDGAETVPVWGNPATSDCKTCHTGSATSIIEGRPAPAKANALSTGHGKTSGTYAQSLNVAANRACTACHDANAAGHFDGDALDKRLILGGSGFPAAYSTITDKNNFCGACHGTAPGNPAPSIKTGINSHQAKPCIGCHDPHGDSNIYMVLSSQTTQNAKDTTATGKFFANVTFTALTGLDSYDEDDGAAGGAGEANSDDLCATCHTVAGGTNHNNRDNSAVDHNQGTDCFSCHKAHTDTTAPFGAGAGNACNSCHGNPPNTGAHGNGSTNGHSRVSSNDKDVEDRSDCAFCHTGADLYTYDPSADQGAGRNHGNAAGRKTILAASVGYSVANGSCSTACHASSAGDGFWTDTTLGGNSGNGLSCNACHYYAASPGSPSGLSVSHDKHFDKGKTCVQCHAVENGGAALSNPTHISVGTGANDLVKIQNRAQAAYGEANLDFTNAAAVTDYTYTPAAHSCSGATNNGLGCHATGAPDWDPADNAGGVPLACTNCHTNTTTTAVNPTSALHGVTPSVSGQRHDNSVAGGCAACHTTVSAQATHMDGTFQGGNGQKTQMGLPAWYTQTADNTGTCASTSCHLSSSDSWAHVWTNTANYYTSSTTSCGGCHGDWNQGWNAGVTHRTDAGPRSTHGSGASYQCKDCHGIESASGYSFTFGSNDWGGASHHGDGKITMNDDAGGTITSFDRVGGGLSGCNKCHADNDGTSSGKHSFATTSWATVQEVVGDALSVGCFSCHGGGTVVGANKNYWPDGANTIGDDTTADNSGAHATHMTKLASAVMGQNITQLLTDNAGVGPAPWDTATADAKQKELCSYCHTNPGADADHGVTYPAEVNSFYTLWSKALDNGTYTAANGTCATTDCHNNKTTSTSPTNFGWYGGAASGCVMCHTDVTAETAHTAHTAAGMGMTIGCDRCHQAATNWGTNTPPATGHIDGTFSVSGGSIAFTYSGFTYPSVKGTCGTNNCHNNGKNGAPRTSSYTWGTPIAGCDACHGDTTASLTTQSHAVHTGSTIQSIACGSCHAAATAASHIDTNVTFGGSVSFTYTGDVAITGSTYGGCGTNNCHNNGKNATPRTSAYTWGTVIAATCGECHGDTAATLTSEAHGAHLNAASTYGRTIVCTDCHSAETNLTNHVNGTINLVGLTYTGDVAITGITFGSCGTNACHQNGSGGAPVTATYDWNTTLAGCSFCHNSAAMASGAHTTHVGTANAWGPYPATGSTNCGECHQANANNTSMAGQTSHINGSVQFTSSTTLATTAACNSCHGGATPAGTAKTNWPTATRVTCGSCHGDYTAAVIGGKTAPANAGTSYNTYGHNKVTNNPTWGGKACTDCHDNTAAGHFDGTSGDDKRMKIVNSQNYTTGANAFCASACHGGTAENIHYANTQTPGGTSDDGILCMTCHNPHGQNGNQDAMIRSSIAGRAVAGFTDKTQRSSYANASFNGVCQVCHDGAEVPYFNRTTFGSHNGTTLCTDCHTHSATTAFSAAGGGCNSCHGYPPVQQLTGAGAAYTYAKVEDYPGGGRAHAVVAHLATTITPADGWTPCAPCHTEADHNMSLGVGNLLTNRDASATWGNEATRYPRVNLSAAYDKGGSAFYNMGARNTTAGMGYCSNASCHFGESPKWDCVPADTTNDPL